MYKCLECGHLFEEGEQAVWKENIGECCGHDYYDEFEGCPICKGDYEKAVKCSICESYHIDNELHGGVCDDCIDSYKNDVDMCYKVGSNDTQKIEINCFLAAMFDEEEINELLFSQLKNNKYFDRHPVDCCLFIDNNRDWFGEVLAEEVMKNEKAKGKS